MLAGVRVLILDDDPDMLEVVCLMLELQGAEVRGVASAPAGVQAVRDFGPHVIISDLSMPEADGFTFMKQVRGLPPQEGGATPALALSAHTFPEYKERAVDAGFDRYLSKPVDPSVVVEIIKELARPPAR
jgi:CheY-like chemotaxis protein